ncbi:hypothetical protein PO124_03220 [Bacillus licheniformis]|nr:hypothetical protein [Bacillus licheniformis]
MPLQRTTLQKCRGRRFYRTACEQLIYWAVNQSIVQRALGAKTWLKGRKAHCWPVYLKRSVCLSRSTRRYCLSPLRRPYSNADTVYPRLIVDLLPTALIGVFAAILFGAILSSFNGSLNSTITLFTLDLYKPLFKPEAKRKSS